MFYMQLALVVIIYALGPVALLYACKKSGFLNKFGTVALAYILGIVIGNIGLVKPEYKAVQDNFTSVTIALALPLLLFSINLKQWSRLALKTGLAVLFGIISVIVVTVAGFYLLKDVIPDAWQVAGLMIGVYIGGTANMAAIMKALDGSPETFILVNAYDIILCIFYFIFLITVAQKFIGRFLLPFKPAPEQVHLSNEVDDFDGWDAYVGIGKLNVLFPLLLAVVLSASIVGISLFLKSYFPVDYQLAGLILSITFISILFSLIPKINQIQKSFQSGMYLIVSFCIVVGSMADFSMFTFNSIYLAVYILIVIIGSVTLQVIFSKIFRIDTDTTLITSTAFIFSAPFVPTVANALRNKEIILSGITIGIIGYTAGNFIGITLAYLLR
ncbi:MAG TPA: hypothetical protein DCY97_04710 [Marinilabiliales bacterium]|jgi:uncharacterized membrane protein|nr:hypothetical protein [Marinilabiliales bacterium]